MFKSYHKLLLSATAALALISTASLAENASKTYENGKKVIDGGVTYPVQAGKTSSYSINENILKGGYTFGRTPTANEIKAWDIDVMPDGTGLPKGEGNVEDGDELYEEKCAMCHGDFGSGGGGYPALGKGNAYEGHKTLTNQRVTPDAEGPIRVFGTYWPQASTLWWYIKTGMPHPAPLSLTDDEVYAITAYILNINELKVDGEVVDDEFVLNQDNFMKIEMPNKDGFIPKIDGKDGLENVRKFYNDYSNYGNGTRCMKDCFDGKPELARIKVEMKDFHPPMSTERSLPAKKEGAKEHPGKAVYEASCAVCHATDSMGAPNIGNKKAWTKKLEKGIDKVYANGINGINGMPPKGGNMDLSDAQFKAAVDYMIENSK